MKQEMFLQCEFSRWLDSKRVLYCASAGGMRTSMITAVNMKRSGYKKGFPDIAIYEPRSYYHALFIELKVSGKPTSEQLAWQADLQNRGYKALIMPQGLDFAEGFNWLRNAVEEYLSL